MRRCMDPDVTAQGADADACLARTALEVPLLAGPELAGAPRLRAEVGVDAAAEAGDIETGCGHLRQRQHDIAAHRMEIVVTVRAQRCGELEVAGSGLDFCTLQAVFARELDVSAGAACAQVAVDVFDAELAADAVGLDLGVGCRSGDADVAADRARVDVRRPRNQGHVAAHAFQAYRGAVEAAGVDVGADGVYFELACRRQLDHQVTALDVAEGVLGQHHLDADAGSGFFDREPFGVQI